MSFIDDIYILNNIKRYSTVPCVHDETVAAHSFFVAAIVIHLHERYSFNLYEAVFMAICHDMPEIELNDLPRGVAEKYPAVAQAFKSVAAEALATLPVAVQTAVKVYEKRDSIEAMIVKLADAMQCKQKAQQEVKISGNEYMKEVIAGADATINDIERKIQGYLR